MTLVSCIPTPVSEVLGIDYKGFDDLCRWNMNKKIPFWALQRRFMLDW